MPLPASDAGGAPPPPGGHHSHLDGHHGTGDQGIGSDQSLEGAREPPPPAPTPAGVLAVPAAGDGQISRAGFKQELEAVEAGLLSTSSTAITANSDVVHDTQDGLNGEHEESLADLQLQVTTHETRPLAAACDLPGLAAAIAAAAAPLPGTNSPPPPSHPLPPASSSHDPLSHLSFSCNHLIY